MKLWFTHIKSNKHVLKQHTGVISLCDQRNDTVWRNNDAMATSEYRIFDVILGRLYNVTMRRLYDITMGRLCQLIVIKPAFFTFFKV